MKDKLVSIGLPIIKEEFLKKAIYSCLNQTYTNFELIIQNNAKELIVKSNIREIVESIKDNRIRYFETENQLPMVQNWNEILKNVNGDFFSILCDDDKWHADFIKEMLDLSRKYPLVNIFHSRVVTIDKFDNDIRLSPLCPEYESGLEFIFHRLAKFRSNFLSDFMVRTNSLKKIGGFVNFPDGWGSDDVTWFKIAVNGGIAYSPKELFYYRESLLNVSNNSNIDNKLIAIDYQYNEIKKIIFEHEHKNTIIYKMIENQLLKYKEIRKPYFYEKKLINKYKLPIIISKLIVLGIRFFKQKKYYN